MNIVDIAKFPIPITHIDTDATFSFSYSFIAFCLKRHVIATPTIEVNNIIKPKITMFLLRKKRDVINDIPIKNKSIGNSNRK